MLIFWCNRICDRIHFFMPNDFQEKSFSFFLHAVFFFKYFVWLSRSTRRNCSWRQWVVGSGYTLLHWCNNKESNGKKDRWRRRRRRPDSSNVETRFFLLFRTCSSSSRFWPIFWLLLLFLSGSRDSFVFLFNSANVSRGSLTAYRQNLIQRTKTKPNPRKNQDQQFQRQQPRQIKKKALSIGYRPTKGHVDRESLNVASSRPSKNQIEKQKGKTKSNGITSIKKEKLLPCATHFFFFHIQKWANVRLWSFGSWVELFAAAASILSMDGIFIW